VVESAVAAAVEPVSVVVSGGHVDRCGAGVAGEVVPAGEPPDVAGLGEDLRGVDRSDPVDLQQLGRMLGQHLHDALLQLLQPRIQ
jgi:hypothetical protein